MLARVAVIAAVLALLAPSLAAAQISPAPVQPSFPTQPRPEVETVITDTDDDTDDGMEAWQQALIVLGGVILLVTIAYAIVLDARRRAPVAADDAVVREKRDPHAPKRKQQRRAKAKTARAARKRNR